MCFFFWNQVGFIFKTPFSLPTDSSRHHEVFSETKEVLFLKLLSRSEQIPPDIMFFFTSMRFYVLNSFLVTNRLHLTWCVFFSDTKEVLFQNFLLITNRLHLTSWGFFFFYQGGLIFQTPSSFPTDFPRYHKVLFS